MEHNKRYWVIISLAVLTTLGGLSYYMARFEYRKPLFEVHFLSLTRGRAIFMRTPGNKTILVGGGQNSEVIREITRRTPFYRRKLDYVIIPSATPAQIGGLIEVVERYEVQEILISKILATSTALTILQREIRKKKIHVGEVERGDVIALEDDFEIEVLFPYEGFKFNKTSLPELALRVRFKETSAYLLGNLSKTIQKDILKYGTPNFRENIVEYYNSAGVSKVSEELQDALKPVFIFSTKEKTAHLVSDGQVWEP